MIQLTIKNLSIATRGKPLVSGINLTISKGKTLCLVGESGSGKTLTGLAILRLLAPELAITSGEISFNNQTLTTLPEADMRTLRGASIAMIFQEPMTALNPVLTIGQQLCEVLSTHTALSKKAQKTLCLEWLSKVNLPSPRRIFNSYPHQLSGGQRQRAMIAMALMLKPKLLIADEPTTALDVTIQKEILALIKNLQAEMGISVLFITHDFGVVKKIAHTVAVMQNGKIVEQGTVKNVLQNPQKSYTKKLLAAMPSLRIAPVPKKGLKRDSKGLKGNKNKKITQPALLTAHKLTKKFPISPHIPFFKAKTVPALVDVSLSLCEGEVIGVVGESGSGKSTLARVISGLTAPNAGEVFFLGKSWLSLSGRQKKALRPAMQMVFQDPFSSLNPRLTIGQNIAEGLRAQNTLPKPKWKSFIQKLLAECGLPADTYTRYPHQFSGGQRQRICIARALAMRPKLIIADEATSALDVSIQAQILELMTDLKHKYNISFLFISHDLRVISNFSDKVIVMQNGRVVEAGLVADVLANPAQNYTKKLLSAVV